MGDGCCDEYDCILDCSKVPKPKAPKCKKNEKLTFISPAPDAVGPKSCHDKPKCKPKKKNSELELAGDCKPKYWIPGKKCMHSYGIYDQDGVEGDYSKLDTP